MRQAENRATEYERNVTKLQKEVDKLEGTTYSFIVYLLHISSFFSASQLLSADNRVLVRLVQ